MSMHQANEDAYKRINKSVNDSFADQETEEEIEEKKSRKRCVVIGILVGIMVVALFVLILVLAIKGGSSTVPDGLNPYTIDYEYDGMWYWQAMLKRTKNVTYPVPVGDENPVFENLKMRVSMMNDHTFRIRVNPVKSSENMTSTTEDITRFEVPEYLLGNLQDDYGMRLAWGNFKSSNKPAGFELFDPMSKKDKIISSSNRNLVFTDKYLEMGFLVNSQHIFGFGERYRSFELDPGNYSSWSDGRENTYDKGTLGNNSYGDHPFVLARLKNNNFVGMFFLNSNAKALEYTHVGKGQSILNFRSTGGILDFFTFTGETPEDVIKAYHQVIGVPYFPPFWSLGLHQSSRQYSSTKMVDKIVENYKENKIPLESIWLDIELLKDYHNFEVDTSKFSNLKGFSKKLQTNNQKLIPVVESGFHAIIEYSSYRQLSEQKLLIKSNNYPDKSYGNLIGNSTAGKSAFVDFLNPGSQTWWVNSLEAFYKATNMDGLWLGLNEITSFCDGECPNDEVSSKEDSNSTLPFNPLGEGRTLETGTISMNAQMHSTDDVEKALNINFNWHSLYGTLQSKATQQFWFDKKKLMKNSRPFVLSRSTFAGAGKYAAHWLGDNYSSWSSMQMSISGIMNFNMFGIPLVGADVCGYFGKLDHELCARWFQLSAFYPFARNHNYHIDESGEPLEPQEAYALNYPHNETARAAVHQRYSFLRYFYTNMFSISKNGGTLVRPLFFEFPEDDKAYEGPEHSFMVGNALKVTPVLEPETVHKGKIDSYFPKNSRFISLNDFTTIVSGGYSGSNKTLDASPDHTLVHMKDGTIIPWQNTTSHHYATTYNLMNDRGLDILVFPDKNGNAEGKLYIDENGDDQIAFDIGNYEYYQLRYSDNTLRINKIDGNGAEGSIDSGNDIIQNVFILGVGSITPQNATACAFSKELVPEDILIKYDPDKKWIQMNVTNSNTLTFNEISAIQYTIDSNDVSFCSPKYTVSAITSQKSENAGNPVKKVMVKSGTNLPDLEFNFILIKDNMVRVMVNDSSNPNAFRVTDDVFNPDYLPLDGSLSIEDIEDVLTVPAVGEEFYFEIHQFKNPQKVLYSTKGERLVYSKNFMQTTALLDSNGRIFGLGERVGDLLLSEGVYTIWTRDEPSPVDEGKRPGGNIYGAHPVYFTQMQSSNEFFAVFDNNAGAQDFIIEKADKKMRITHVKTSGVTDMIFILNGPMSQVSTEYIDLVGKPSLVPDWSLGWHQCRYGYNNSDQVREVVESFIKYNIPLDAIWTDIDYMDMYRDFTLSSANFSDLPGYVSNWRNNNAIKYVPIMDAAIAYEPDNKSSAYSRGSSKNVFIKDPVNKRNPFVGKVWPGPAVFIDWLKDSAETYWRDELKRFSEIIEFDGLWIDMNEAANFCNGPCTAASKVDVSIQDSLFYTPGARDLNYKAISVDAIHDDGTLEFEAHSLYGFYMGKASSKYFTEDLDQRQFVISRSTYAGFGKYASHWLGDNFSLDKMLKFSVNGIYLFNMFGVPVVGADICGFLGDTNADLCARWYALGAFYPFARNHNDKSAIPQEPYIDDFMNNNMTDTNMTYTEFIKEMSWKRYALHRYQYTCLHMSSLEGTVYFKPLFYNYPEDNLAFSNVENNILLGDAIKVSPVLDIGTYGEFYFPEKGSLWCPLWPKYNTKCYSGQTTLKAEKYPLDEVLVHIKSGSIVPLQLDDPSYDRDFMNIENLRNIPLDLAILADSKYLASGIVRYDDGKTQNITQFTEFGFRAQGASPFVGKPYLDIFVQINLDDSDDQTSKNQNLQTIAVYNSAQFKLSKSSTAEVTFKDGTTLNLGVEYNDKHKICKFVCPDSGTIEIRNVDNIHIESQ